MFIQAFDAVNCVNDKLSILEIPEHETKSKDLDIDYTPPKPKKPRIPPMNHPGIVSSLENLSNSKNTTRMIKIQKLPENEAHQYNKPQQKLANTSIILGHFPKTLDTKISFHFTSG